MNIRRLAWVNLISNPFNTTLSILLMTFGVAIISLLLVSIVYELISVKTVRV